MSWHRAASRPPWFRAAFCFAVAPFLLALAGIGPSAAVPKAARPEPRRVDVHAPIPDLSPAFQREQLFARLGVDRWHRAGFRGQGVKVAILDSGFRDYRSFLGKALPARVTTRSFRADHELEARDSQHGILCGEVVHALAPDAELLFVNWDADRPQTFLEAVRWAREQGANVLSCSLIMPSWSDGEGGGEVNAALAQIVGGGEEAGDMLCFASAGNTAQRHWSGPLQRDASGFHWWAEGHRNNGVVPWGNERVSVELYGQGCDPLELLVHESGTGKLVGSAPASRAGSPCGCPVAVVRFQPQTDTKYFVRVQCDKAASADKGEPFHLVVLGGTLRYTTASGSISFPADSSAALAVGAVDGDGERLTYSSCGPNSPLPKPDFVAQVPFPSLCRDRAFAGTSAAAPQAAALAALLWSRQPASSAAAVRKVLRESARDLGPGGHDLETGYGLMVLPRID